MKASSLICFALLTLFSNSNAIPPNGRVSINEHYHPVAPTDSDDPYLNQGSDSSQSGSSEFESPELVTQWTTTFEGPFQPFGRYEYEMPGWGPDADLEGDDSQRSSESSGDSGKKDDIGSWENFPFKKSDASSLGRTSILFSKPKPADSASENGDGLKDFLRFASPFIRFTLDSIPGVPESSDTTGKDEGELTKFPSFPKDQTASIHKETQKNTQQTSSPPAQIFSSERRNVFEFPDIFWPFMEFKPDVVFPQLPESIHNGFFDFENLNLKPVAEESSEARHQPQVEVHVMTQSEAGNQNTLGISSEEEKNVGIACNEILGRLKEISEKLSSYGPNTYDRIEYLAILVLIIISICCVSYMIHMNHHNGKGRQLCGSRVKAEDNNRMILSVSDLEKDAASLPTSPPSYVETENPERIEKHR